MNCKYYTRNNKILSFNIKPYRDETKNQTILIQVLIGIFIIAISLILIVIF